MKIRALQQSGGRRRAMAKVDVVNLSGKKVGSLELADAVFGRSR
jgi:hypothetical protein